VTVRLLALYETPTEPVAFDRHYREAHIPLRRQLPGPRGTRSAVTLRPVRGGAPYYRLAELEWDTMDELRAVFASPEGRATAADAACLQELTPIRSMIFIADDSLT
jgi:uncharacterized protein (TIGR02118 family)